MTTTRFAGLFAAELERQGIRQCRACDAGSSHHRGFVRASDPDTVHIDRSFATRSTLYRGLHEVGHCVTDRRGGRNLPRWERERAAEAFARQAMRRLGVPIPRKCVVEGDAYVERWRSFGARISAGQRGRRLQDEAGEGVIDYIGTLAAAALVAIVLIVFADKLGILDWLLLNTG